MQPTLKFTADEPLQGLFLRWNTLSQSEKVVCLGIVLIPLWWLWGWSFLLLSLAIGLVIFEYVHHGNFWLKRPSLLVVAFLGYGFYDLISNAFYSFYHESSIGFRDLTDQCESVLAPSFLLWYIQSRNIRVRPMLITWAFSVVVLVMLVLWLYAVIVAHQASFSPPRSLFGVLTHKPPQFAPGLGNTNYLVFYRAEDQSLPGFARYFLCFHGPESLALVTSFISLLALDLKQRHWSILLFCSSTWLLLMSGTRSAWLALPFTILVRSMIRTGIQRGAWLICMLIACCSCLFMFPPITNSLIDLSTHTSQSTSAMRKDSSDVRAEIYARTTERLIESSDWQFMVGHTIPGETVLREYEPAKVGTHSFYLGTLLYRQGCIGTVLFALYWFALIAWLYQTRQGRPIATLLIFLLMSLTFSVMAYESVVNPITLLSAVARQSQQCDRRSYDHD